MSSYYDRRFSILLDDVTFIEETGGRQFRIVFNVLHDFGGYVSYADISIYGLSRDTEAKVLKQGQNIDLRAGYATSIDYIFRGQIVNLLREKNGADRITRLICIGGAENRKETSVVKTLGAGSALTEIIQSCADALGYPLIINGETFDTITYSGGYTMAGSPVDYLKKLAREHSFNWVIENNRLVVVKEGEYRNGDINQISQFTGMIGQPEITETGADVEVKLNPKIKIGGRFQITSEYKTFNFNNIFYQNVQKSQGTGTYRIFKIEHKGDSYGDAWSSKITGFV